MECPLISIIIPAYNAEAYLARALDSLLAQSLPCWEAICIDDGSTDGTASILDSYAARDKRFIVRHTKNGGAAKARNIALQMAQGEFVTMLDADDWLDNTTLEKLSTPLCEAQHVSVAVCDFTRHTSMDLTQTVIWGHIRNGKHLCGIHQADTTNLSSMLVCSCGKMYRRKIIAENNLHYRTGQKVGEDAFFVMCYLAHTNHIAFIPEGLYHYANSATSAVNAYYAGTVPLQTYLDNMSTSLFACEYAETIRFDTPAQQTAYYSYLLRKALIAYAECLRTGIKHHREYKAPIKHTFRLICDRLGSHLSPAARIGIRWSFWSLYWNNRIIASLQFRLRRLLNI